MKKRFSVAQTVTMLKQAEMGLPVADLIRRVSISKQTFLPMEEVICAGLETTEVREFEQISEQADVTLACDQLANAGICAAAAFVIDKLFRFTWTKNTSWGL